MKTYIETLMREYPSIFPNPAQVLEHLFCTLGNGIELNDEMKIDENCSCGIVYKFPKPVSFKHVYPWTDLEKFQPFRKYIGCKDIGFKDSVEYFLSCLKITPQEIAGDWLLNIDLIRKVLLEE